MCWNFLFFKNMVENEKRGARIVKQKHFISKRYGCWKHGTVRYMCILQLKREREREKKKRKQCQWQRFFQLVCDMRQRWIVIKIFIHTYKCHGKIDSNIKSSLSGKNWHCYIYIYIYMDLYLVCKAVVILALWKCNAPWDLKLERTE